MSTYEESSEGSVEHRGSNVIHNEVVPFELLPGLAPKKTDPTSKFSVMEANG